MSRLPFHIVGGGIAGLATSLALARIGWPSVVVEQSAEFAETGAGIQIGPNAVRALRWLGVWERLQPEVSAPPSILVRDAYSGKLLQSVALGRTFEDRFGEPYRVALRAALHEALLSAARRSEHISLLTNIRADAKVPVTAAGLIAADGVRSAIREKLWAGRLRPAGQTLFRTLLDKAGDESVTLWLAAGAHLVHYPAGGKLNMVATVEGQSPAGTWDQPATSADVLAGFSAGCPQLLTLLGKASAWRRWAGADVPALPRWHDGSRLLIGDAAHASLPFLAQGAAMALEDAVVLARCLAGETGLARAFSTFEAKRKPRTERIRAASAQTGRLYHLGGPSRIARNLVLRSLGSNRFIERLAWIYDFDPGSS